MDAADEHRVLVTEGPAAQALDVCRRLLRTDDGAQQAQVAALVLDRLRAGAAGDEADDVNALLRLLGNYVAPTPAFTEEVLALLHICEHRVVLIHHLPKLTYQSKECVKLVVDAYLELLASDRALLVPILGSLADMPLDFHDKGRVIDATQSLLGAAEEEDIPAVVQSLLSMATVSTAPKVAGTLRAECARVQPGTLRLTIEVVGRFATAGSTVMNSFLHVIRQTDTLTTFDVILLTFFIGRSAENEAAVRAINAAAQAGKIHAAVVCATVEVLLLPEWITLLPYLVRFISCLLAACFNNRVKSSAAVDLVVVAVRSLVSFIDARSVVREEALTLLLTIVSHPPKLLLFANSSASLRNRGFLAWKVAEVIAEQLAELAGRNPRALSPYSHLFLDHLHGISASSSDYGGDQSASYPTHILDTLCSTMALLTKQERGVYSLLMITIQKQLVARPGGPIATTLVSSSSSGPSASAVDLRQLMAVFLTGYLLKHNVVVEPRDRKSLASWLLRLLSSTSRNETLLHVIRFVRDEILRGGGRLAVEGTSTRAMFCSSMSQVFRKKGFALLSHERATEKSCDGYCIALLRPEISSPAPDDDDEVMDNPLVVDVASYVSKMRFGVAVLPGSRDCDDTDAAKSSWQREYTTNVLLIRELFRCQLVLCGPEEHKKTLTAGFLFPAAYEAGVLSSDSDSLSPSANSSVIWGMVCALDICIMSTNFLAEQYALKTNQQTQLLELARGRLASCFKLQDQLERMLAIQRFKIHTLMEELPDIDSQSSNTSARVLSRRRELESLLTETSVVEQMVSDSVRPIQGEQPSASLFGLDLRVICLTFEGQWKRSGPTLPLAHELLLLQSLNRHLQPANACSTNFSARGSAGDTKTNTPRLSTETKMDMLISQAEGRRTMKYLTARADGLARAVADSIYTHRRPKRRRKDRDEVAFSQDESEDEEDADDYEATAVGIIQDLLVRSLECIYSVLRTVLDECASTDPTRQAVLNKVIELLTAGVSPRQLRLQLEQGNAHREILFRHLARQCLQVTDASLSCSGVDLIVSLVQGTNKEQYVSQLCLALLCQPLRSRKASSNSSLSDTSAEGAESTGRFTLDGLPVSLLPNAVVAPRGGSLCSLAKYRCPSTKWRHCVYLVVGVWAFAPSASLGSLMLLRLIEETRALVESTAGKQRKRKRRMRVAEKQSDASSSEENFESMDVAVTGEHQVLKSLTTESLPFFVDAIFLCAAASFFRASPGGKSSRVYASSNPFDEVCVALDVVTRGLKVFVSAERVGLTMPVRTNQLVLRSSAFVMRSLRALLLKCAAWRVQRRVDDDAGAVVHLWVVLDSVSQMLIAMDKVLASFQERVMLKMQNETAAIGAKARLNDQNVGDSEDDAAAAGSKVAKRKRLAGGKKGWTNELLAKAFGRKFRPRRWISKNEAVLLPYFSHSIQELRDFLDEQRLVHNFDPERQEFTREETPSSYNAIGRLPLGSDEFLRFCRDDPVEDLLASGVLGDWVLTSRHADDDDEGDEVDEDANAGDGEESDDLDGEEAGGE